VEQGGWNRLVFNLRFHDPSIFIDQDTGKMYIFHGYCDIWLTEMENDLSGVKSGGIDKVILSAQEFSGCKGAEGSHAYKLNGFYYLFLIAFKSGRRVELCYRASGLDGVWEGKIVLDKGLGGRTGGVAQGGIVETPDGDWYGFFFQDRDAVGRVPVLVPMRWDNEFWPVFGDSNGNIPVELKIKQVQDYDQNLYVSDEFNSDKLQLAWQWNHNPDNANWSLGERPGYLRLKTGRTSKTIYHARNTLTQRTFEPACEGTVALEPANMKDGDKAGIVLLQSVSGFVGIEQESGKKYIVMYTGDNENDRGMNATETRQAKVEFTGSRIYLKVSCLFRTDISTAERAVFSYSLDGMNWQKIGSDLNMRWTMAHFTGARFGLFNYATKTAGGYVDFDYFHL
jgi:beta-xylosidase